MAALAASDWTVAEVSYSSGSGGVYNHEIRNDGRRVKRFSMTLATAGTYPSGGIPIPTAKATWGMKTVFERITNIYDSSQFVGDVVKYSATGQVIRLFQMGATTSDAGTAQQALTEFATTATAGTGGGRVLYVEAIGY